MRHIKKGVLPPETKMALYIAPFKNNNSMNETYFKQKLRKLFGESQPFTGVKESEHNCITQYNIWIKAYIIIER